jgi:secretion/DNA translocation related TadE-like protein
MATATALVAVGAVCVARHRVNAAADLSALAAARLAIIDPRDACDRATIIASANGAHLVKCTITAEVADVWTSAALTLPGLGTHTLTGRSRAGPGQPESTP